MEQTAIGVEVYVVESGLSRFTVRAFAGGMFSALGHNPTFAIREFTGEARFQPGTLDGASVQVHIKTASLAIQDDISEKDRREIELTMHRDVVETGRYPGIDFKSTSVSANKAAEGRYWVNLIGELTLRGQTQSQPVSAQVAFQGDTMRASGEFSLLQSKFGIKPVSFAGGTLKLKDELKFSFDIVARKQEG